MEKAFTISGGVLGGTVKGITLATLLPSAEAIISVLICGAMGAAIGWSTNQFLNWLKKKLSKKK